MTNSLILDTGPLVALIDADQTSHSKCVSFFESWNGHVLTTEAVVTEATHLLHRTHGGPSACVQFILTGAATVVPTTLDQLKRVHTLLNKHRDVPMDYADATLVTLAEGFRIDLIFTLDRRGFDTYRWDKHQHFNIVPQYT